MDDERVPRRGRGPNIAHQITKTTIMKAIIMALDQRHACMLTISPRQA